MAAEMHHAVDQLRGYGYKIDSSLLDVTLIEADKRILPKVGRIEISHSVARELEKIGVQVLTNTRVVEVTDRGITFHGGYFIPLDMIIWSAGIRGPDVLKGIGGLETNHLNQLVVKRTGQTTVDERIFAIGDCCACPQEDGSWVPPRGQAARQMGHMVAENIVRMSNGRWPSGEYVYRDLGSLVNLSKFHTVGNVFSFLGGGILVEGKIARFAYLSLYRRHLIEIYGPVRGVLMVVLKSLNRIIRPHLKLH
jgi:NADH:ubiquinone reductase (H+-translocating)